VLIDIDNPKITVIMSVKDGDPWLASSVKSILSQTESDFEFLIADDSSTDRSSEILSAFEGQDNRIKVYTNASPMGLASSLNSLIAISRGDYIVRMDADDVSHPRRLEVQLSYMEKNRGIGVCFSRVNIVLDSNEFLCVKWSPISVHTALFLLPFINYFVHPTAFVRREVYLQDGFYNPYFMKAQDWELWQRLISKGVRFGIVRDVLLDYRLLVKSSSAAMSSSSAHGIAYFKAMVLVRNRHKLKSIRLINKIPKRIIHRYLINLVIPQWLFTFAVIINSKFNKNSSVRILLEQHQKSDD
jgi:glycosyltransferase involved in cell wall biosynthesis